MINCDRRLARSTRGTALRRRHALQARRLPALPLQDRRLRRDLDADRRNGIAGDHFTRAVRADPRAQGPALRRHRARGLRLVRRRRVVAEPAAPTCRSCRSPTWRCATTILIAATQGRGIWMLDDLALLRQLDGTATASSKRGSQALPAGEHVALRAGQPRAVGALARQWFGHEPARWRGGALRPLERAEWAPQVKLEFLDATGRFAASPSRGSSRSPSRSPTRSPRSRWAMARRASASRRRGPRARWMNDARSAARSARRNAPKPRPRSRRSKEKTKAPAAPGMNRFVWNLRTEAAEGFEGLVLWAGAERGLDGPAVVPGDYEVRLTVGESQPLSQRFTVLADPRSSATRGGPARRNTSFSPERATS